MLELDCLQVNRIHPPKAVTLIHHIETIIEYHTGIINYLGTKLNVMEYL